MILGTLFWLVEIEAKRKPLIVRVPSIKFGEATQYQLVAE